MTGAIYLEDLQVGQMFVGGSHAISAEQIKEYATAFDPQPFHMDEVAASESFFGGLAASGWLVASVTMRLLVTGVLPIGGGIIGAGADVSWPRPTRPGDVLHVTADVLSITPSQSKPDRGIATLKIETVNQRAEVVQRLIAKLVIFRRPVPPSSTHEGDRS